MPLVLMKTGPEPRKRSSKRVTRVTEWDYPYCGSDRVDDKENDGTHTRHSAGCRNGQTEPENVAGKQQQEDRPSSNPVLNFRVLGMLRDFALEIQATPGPGKMVHGFVKDGACETGRQQNSNEIQLSTVREESSRQQRRVSLNHGAEEDQNVLKQSSFTHVFAGLLSYDAKRL